MIIEQSRMFSFIHAYIITNASHDKITIEIRSIFERDKYTKDDDCDNHPTGIP